MSRLLSGFIEADSTIAALLVAAVALAAVAFVVLRIRAARAGGSR